MSEDAQERSEEATPKRKQELKDKGQVVRSKELMTLLNLLGAGCALFVVGGHMASELGVLLTTLYTLDPVEYHQHAGIIKVLYITLESLFTLLLPFLILVVVALLLGPTLLGGWVISSKQVMPKLERMNPIKGLKKMVSVKGFVELIKSILKIMLVASICALSMYFLFDDFIKLAHYPIFIAIEHSLYWVLAMFLIISSSMIVVTMIDIPFQIADFIKQSKMTKQQVKDEFKETEGRPEVKSKIKSLQREMSKRRMMDAVQEADVVITNPTHFAVALKYDESMRAPKLVAKGLDLIAFKMREKAEEANVPVVRVPPLARAIYFSTEIEDEVPHGLYKAVAKILAYIYQLQQYKRGKIKKPRLPDDFDIPDSYQR